MTDVIKVEIPEVFGRSKFTTIWSNKGIDRFVRRLKMLNLNGSQLIVEDLLLLAFEKSMSFIKSKSYLTERHPSVFVAQVSHLRLISLGHHCTNSWWFLYHGAAPPRALRNTLFERLWCTFSVTRWLDYFQYLAICNNE